jgi:hypothetical protein
VRPLSIIVLGLGLIVADFRTEALDFVPDPVGWALVALGAWRLSLGVPAVLAAAAGVASFADAWLPFRYVKIDPVTGEPVPEIVAHAAYPVRLEYEDASGWRLVGLTLVVVLGVSALWLLLTQFADLARATGRDQPARQLSWLRWLLVASWAGPYLGAVVHAVVYESGEFDPVWNNVWLTYSWLAAVAVLVLVAYVLMQERDRLWALPASTLRISPWDLRRHGADRAKGGSRAPRLREE